MSALGHKRTFALHQPMSALPPNSGHEMAIRDLRSLSVALEPKMSALPPKADIRQREWHVRFGPEAELQPTQYLDNSRLCSRSLDLAHVPVVYGGHLTIVPRDRD